MNNQSPQVLFRPPTDPDDPEGEMRVYINHRWVQGLTPIRTECILCHKQSPVIHIYLNGASIAFGDASLLRRGGYKYRDISRDVSLAFAEHGWKFQKKRSYCPECKGLNSV